MRRSLLYRRLSAVVLCMWLAVAIGPVLLPHNDGFDVACSDELFTSRHPVSQFENVLPSLGDGHCEVCHLQRVARGALTGLDRDVLSGGIESSRQALRPQHLSALHAPALPARAPPSARL